MNKKLLSGIMSGLMLASSCSAVGAEAPKGIKDRIINSVVKHKKLILTSAAISAVADGAVIWLLTHNNNIKMDYSKFTDFENFFGNFKKAVEACRKSVTVFNVKVSDANKLASTLLGCNNKESESTKEIVIKGIDGLGDDAQGTLVLEKTKKEDGTIKITFKFEEEKKAEEKKEETNVNPEDGVNKEENKKAETEVNEEDNKDEENHDVEASKDFELKILEPGKNMCYEKQKEIIEGITKIKNRSDESNKAYESVENSIKKFFNAFNNGGPFEPQEAYIEYLAALEDAQRLL